jgi:hypothetical protein
MFQTPSFLKDIENAQNSKTNSFILLMSCYKKFVYFFSFVLAFSTPLVHILSHLHIACTIKVAVC